MTNETLELFEARISENLFKLATEEDKQERERLVREVEKLSSKLAEAEKTVYEYADSEAQRQLDDVKSQRTYEAEVRKSAMDWKRTLVEVGKFVVPACVSLYTLKVWDLKFDQVLKFEETGRFVSSAFRNLKFPRIF